MTAQKVSKRPTIRDVARLARVSPSTVSQVLRGRKGYASQETTKRILAAVKELGYRPDAIAQSLVTARTRTIGLIISSITGPLFPQVLAGIEQEARQQEYSVLLVSAKDIEQEQAAVQIFQDKRVDAVIFMTTSREEPDLAFISQMAAEGYPIVVINRPLGDPRIHEIVWDDVAIGRIATEHLIGLGHSQIAHVAGTLGPAGHSYRAAVERLAGYCEALANAGLTRDERLLIEAGHSYARAFEATNHLLKLDEPPTAIFAVDDTVAVGVMNALQRASYKVPHEISVVGAGGAYDELQTEPPLTTVYMPIKEAGRRAARHVIGAIDGHESAVPHREVLTPELRICGSTGPPPDVQSYQKRVDLLPSS
jgi:LacI family transcriptional regulator